MDFLIHGIEEYNAIIIMSEKNDEIRESIVRVLSRGVTIYNGRGGMTGKPMHILYCVVTRLEIGSVKNIVKEIDETAFVIIHPLADAAGGIIKKTALH